MIEIKIQTNPFPLPLGISLKDETLKLELEIIKEALKRHRGNVCAAAKAIGLNRNTVNARCKKNKINLEEYRL